MRLCESPGQFLTPHFTFPFATVPASSPPSSSSLVVVDALASAELLLSRVGTSRRGAPVLFGSGGGSGREGGVATMISRTRWRFKGRAICRVDYRPVWWNNWWWWMAKKRWGSLLQGRLLRREVRSSLCRCRAHLYTNDPKWPQKWPQRWSFCGRRFFERMNCSLQSTKELVRRSRSKEMSSASASAKKVW